MSVKYRHIKLNEQIKIDKIYSFHYSELQKDFVFGAEKHNFWEFLYVDKGEVEITTGDRTFHLKQGDIIFYTPNEPHSLHCNRKIPPNIFIISFASKSEPMRFFSQKSFQLDNEEQKLLSLLINEGDQLFIVPIDQSKKHKAAKANDVHPLERQENPPFGAEQMIKNMLEMLFIRLIRYNSDQQLKPKLTTVTKQKSEEELISRIALYIEENLHCQLALDDLCSEFAISKPYLSAIFRAQKGCGAKEYMCRLRIERAKRYIREESCNLSEISERLGYSGIHYFSRQFKKWTGMSPSHYLKSMRIYMQ